MGFLELGPLLRDLVGGGTVFMSFTWTGKRSRWKGNGQTPPWGIWRVHIMFTVLRVSEALGTLSDPKAAWFVHTGDQINPVKTCVSF